MNESSIVRRNDWSGRILFLLLTLFGLLMLAPLVYLTSTAFKPKAELFLFPPRFFVMNPTLLNFTDLLSVTESSLVPFSRYIFNSIIVAGSVVIGGIAIGSMAAYPLSKHKGMPFGRLIFKMIILALMFAPAVTQIPQYLVMTELGMMNTYWALILPGLASPIGLFLMKQFLDQIPDALLEAARIDGANEVHTFRKIIFPLLQPAVATYALFSFIAAWNDSWSASVFTTSDQMKTLPFAIMSISGGVNDIARAGAMAASSFLMIIPTLVVFIVTQRKVMETMAHSGIKG
ncbi:carbohydrate ABC transporter permease [Paenibacillus mendelii]|uniref:Carbohydrate ABC transporter permease n=1 Tax=Paenibacillus mendelii TaxID=206163 RepID=A0ABV6JAR4_9BACL|nr:carbohydrate ABC transporter permease [Paenibacillus mendelii]MCQ6563114.1 carbohydrate ABC transporter permease [Paenibacillus mendelii]